MRIPKKDKLPDEIVEKSRWILWFEEENEKGNKPTKRPSAPWETGHWKSADPLKEENWTDFETALKYAKEKPNYGPGFVFSDEDDIMGIDLDNCIEDGKIKGVASEIIKEANSYTELSPSGKGVHVLVKGNVSAIKPPEEEIEVYPEKRFFTVTGSRLKESSGIIRESQELLSKLEKKFGKRDVEYYTRKRDELNIMDVVPTDELERKGKQLQGPHPIHGSDTGMNFTLDPKKNTWYCHHSGHNCGGGPFEWIAVESGIVDCGEWDEGKTPLKGDKWIDTVEVALDDGLIDEKKAKELMGKRLNEDDVREALENAIEKYDSVSLHPAIDYNSEIGVTFGCSVPSSFFNGASEEGENQKVLISSDSLIVGQGDEVTFDSNSVTNQTSIRKANNMSMDDFIRLQILKAAGELSNNGEIENGRSREDFFDGVYNKVDYYWYHQDDRWYTVIACWIIGTYIYQLFDVYPPLKPQGERRTGKTTVARIIQKFSWNPTGIESSLRVAPLFRRIQDSRPVFAIDITKMSNRQKYEITDVIEQGIEKGGTVSRCIGDENDVKEFNVYCPKVIASRDNMSFDPKTIKIITRRPPSKDLEKKYTQRRAELFYDQDREEIVGEAMKMALTEHEKVKKAYNNEEQTDDLCGRRFRLWRPLLAICKVFAPRRYDEVRELAEEEEVEVFDEIHVIETAILSSLMDRIDKMSDDKKTMKMQLTGSDSVTALVNSELGTDYSYQRVKGAMDNLGIISKKEKKSGKNVYYFNVERVKDRASDRGMGEGEEYEELELDDDIRTCEICEEEMGIEKEAVEEVYVNGRKRWVCEECKKEIKGM